MADDSHTAAAVPVPDGGDDTLRRAIVTTIGNHTVPIKATLPNGEQTWPASIHILIGESEVAELADAVAPLIRDHVAAAVQAERERARKVIKALPHGKTNDTPWVPDFDAGWRHGRMDALAALDGTEATDGTR